MKVFIPYIDLFFPENVSVLNFLVSLNGVLQVLVKRLDVSLKNEVLISELFVWILFTVFAFVLLTTDLIFIYFS